MNLNSVVYEIGDKKEKVDGVAKIKEWVSGKNGLDKLAIEYAEKFGQDLADNKLATAQIRNVFGEVRRIQMKMMDKDKWEDSPILLLRPKLAYSAKRAVAKTGVAQKFADVLSAGVKEITEGADVEDKKRRFQNFADFFEAVLAYHKYYGGN